MKKSTLIPIIIIILGLAVSGGLLLSSNKINQSTKISTTQTDLRKADLEIKNMFCVGCRSSIVNSIMGLPGVVQADADTRTKSGWVIYDPEQTTKEKIMALPIFQAYPAHIVQDQEYRGTTQNNQATEIPSEIEHKLNLLAEKLNERNVELESFFQEELDDAINGGYYDKANNLLDNFLQAYE
jgi:copper chaperone CopZ